MIPNRSPSTILLLLQLLIIPSSTSKTFPPTQSSTALLPLATHISSLSKSQLPLPPPPPAQPTQLPILHHQQHSLQKRAPTWTTVTVFVNTVTAYPDPTPNSDQTPKTVITTQYNPPAAGIQTTQPTSTHIIPLGTQTSSTSSYAPLATPSPSVPASDQPSNGPSDRACYPGEASQRYPGTLSLTRPTQTTTLLVMVLYLLVMLVCWNLFLVRYLIFPIKLVVIIWHELGHLVISIFLGWRVEQVQIDPNIGGSVKLYNEVVPAAVPLFGGYLSSCLFGGLMVFCGFNTLASKIASIFIAMSLVGVMWWAVSPTSKLLVVGAIGVLVAFWFIDHAGMLRYYVLLMGVLSCWYILFDVMDDFIFRKYNPCCPILFEQRWPKIAASQWMMIWILYSALNFAAWILLAIAVWRQTPRGMFCQSQQFLPT